MARRAERMVVVKRRTTFLLLIVVTVAMVAITLWISGKAYNKVDAEPFREIRLIQERLAEGPMPFHTLIALTMPLILNVLLFLPWGFLMFILLDTPSRGAGQAYLLTFLFAIAFSFGVEAWQYFLPTRVTDVNDVIWNGVGAVVGAFFGHLRKRVRISFE